MMAFVAADSVALEIFLCWQQRTLLLEALEEEPLQPQQLQALLAASTCVVV